MIHIGVISPHGLVGQYILSQIQHIIGDQCTSMHYFTRDKRFHADCYDLNQLQSMDIIVSLAPSTYCLEVHPELRAQKWDGYWLDASSALRFKEHTCLALPPINHSAITTALQNDIRDFSGPNCTTSLLALGLANLLKQQVVDTINVSTYQSLSGAGNQAIKDFQKSANQHSLHQDEATDYMNHFFKQDDQTLGQVTPWIDAEMNGGMTREEYKMQQEITKLTGQNITLNAVCVRIPTLCTHAQTAFVTLKQPMTHKQLCNELASTYNKIIPNNKQDTLAMLAPMSVYNTPHVHIGRIRMLNDHQFSCYIIGDQLQWGASLPIVHTLEILLDNIKQKTASR